MLLFNGWKISQLPVTKINIGSWGGKVDIFALLCFELNVRISFGLLLNINISVA